VAIVGVVLALSRAFVIEAGTAFDPEAAMMGEPLLLQSALQLRHEPCVGSFWARLCLRQPMPGAAYRWQPVGIHQN
jgi:hypothetical protein